MPLTQLGGGFHHSPGLVPALADDQVQQVGPQAVMQDLSDGGTQVLQNQMADVRAYRAVSQFGLLENGKR